MLCKSCSGKECRSLSTAENRIEIECPACSGHGCDECDDGHFELDGCPNRFCSPVVSAIDLIDLFGKGLPPITGGALDQSASFVEAARFFESEESKVSNDRSSRNPD